jgi:histidinol-phosphate/aromatic aminotransferase/cobyric acid decarboxylase-like protein
MAVIVNPNSPTGRHVARRKLEGVLARIPIRTRIWIDETYVEYAGIGESLEDIAAQSQNMVVCKSMSKVYALSGARAAYLCAPPTIARSLRRVTPPWAVSLPAQVAAIKALDDPDYYASRYRETHQLSEELARS